jgi:hypothetical protein
MKIAYILTFFLFCFAWASASLNETTDFCEGWEEGYCEGWKYDKYEYAICPTAPPCPLPNLNRDTYTDGYNRGFVKGRQDAKGD